ncbi:hypothetical protein [Nocardia nova]|uniref:hypothetical protein n=1 Tax=Nocardia nova TaxID=37330 RepID=UPI0004AF5804|nr:hypothetical protein [Nocardia nova]
MRRLLLVLLVLIPAGCSHATSGPPQPGAGPLPHTDFGVPLTAEGRAHLELAEGLRTLDPCGLIDTAAPARYGHPEAMTTRTLTGCTLEVRTAAADPLAQVSVTVAGHGNTASAKTAQTFRIEDMTLPVNAGSVPGSLCGFTLPVEFAPKPAVREPRSPADPAGYLSIDARFFGEDTCEVAKQATASVITAFRDNRIPHRDHARIPVPLTDRSPCELISRLPQDHPVKSFDPGWDPSQCSFTVGNADARPAVNVTFALQNPDNVLRPSGPQRLEQLAGHPVLLQETGGGACQIVAPVGTPVASIALSQPPVAPDTHRTVLAVDAQCSVLDALAPVALDLFGANH